MAKLRKRITPVALALITAVGTFSPVVAHADTVVDPPTTKIAITSNVATVAAHRAAETAPMILGANLKTSGGVTNTMGVLFGSDYNSTPNQYLYNFRVNPDQSQDDVIKILPTAVSPMMADISGVSTGTQSDIYLGNQANGGQTYESILGNSYHYTTLDYGCSTITAMETTMTSLASAMVNTAIYDEDDEIVGYKTGLYGDPVAIANKYVNYIEGTVSYINNNVSAANKKTVAILALDDDEDSDTYGQYIAYTSSYQHGTSINRAAEYLASTTNNIVDSYSSNTAKMTSNGDGSYAIVDNTILENVDAFVLTAFQGSNMTDADLSGFTRKTGSIVFDSMPASSYGIYMNSAENALGMVSMIMGIYEGTSGVTVDCEDAVAYYYSNFYHIKTEYIDDLANTHFGGKFNYSTLEDDDAAEDAVSAYEAILSQTTSND